jgi:hypothetical protein
MYDAGLVDIEPGVDTYVPSLSVVDPVEVADTAP